MDLRELWMTTTPIVSALCNAWLSRGMRTPAAHAVRERAARRQLNEDVGLQAIHPTGHRSVAVASP